jgi:hypothetical protein
VQLIVFSAYGVCSFSKYKRRLECAIKLFQFYWDFINEFKRGTTPAMLEGLTDHVWDWHEFFISQLTTLNWDTTEFLSGFFKTA